MRNPHHAASASFWVQSSMVTAFVLVITLLTSVIIARLLGPEGRGALTAATVWPAIIAGVMCLSLNEATVVLLAGAEPQYEMRTNRSLITASLVLHLAAGVLAAAICAVIVPSALSPERSELVATAIIYGVSFCILTMISMHQRAVLQGEHRTTALNALRIAQPLAWLALITIAGLTTGLTWELVAYAAIAALAAACVTGAWFVRPTIQPFPVSEIQRLLRRGGQFHTANLTLYAAAEADKLLLVAFMGNREVGLYVVAHSVAGLVFGLVSQTLGVRMLSDVAATEPPERAARVRRYTHAGAMAASMLGLGAMTAAPLLPILYGEDFRSAVILTQILVAGFIIKAIRSPIDLGLRAMKSVLPGVAAEATALLVFVICALALKGPLDLVGFCVAFVMAQFASLLCISALAVGRLGVSIGEIWGLEEGYYVDHFHAVLKMFKGR